MAMGPINYAVDVGNPIQSFMSGVGQMQGLQMNDQNMAAQKQQMEAMAQQQQQQAAAAERAKAFQAQFGTLLSDPSLGGEKIGQFMAQFPEYSKEITSSFGMLSDERKAKGVRFAGEVYTLLDGGNVDMAREKLQERLTAAENSGDKATVASMKTALMMMDNDPTGKTAKNFARFMGNAMVGGDFESMIGAGGGRVQSSKILDDGTVVAVNTDGSVVVRNNAGDIVTGQEAADAVARANEFGTNVQGERAAARTGGSLAATAEGGAAAEGAKKAGQQGQDLALKAFESASKARKSISNIDGAIDALDKGANVGVIANQFPSWNSATIALDNARNQMGLDVVGSVTFGALSEGELNLAMATALPKFVDPQDMKNWLVEKRNAQMKLIGYMEEQAQFLSKPGNTLNDWLKLVEGKASPQGETSAPASNKPRTYMNILNGG
jgi:hypothetical protein